MRRRTPTQKIIGHDGRENAIVSGDRKPEPKSFIDVAVKVDGEERSISILEETASHFALKIDGRALTFERPPAILPSRERVPLPSSHHAGFLPSPLPGLIISIDVGEGDEVEPGAPLVTIEAMKMESIIRSDRRARVRRVIVRKGEAVRKGQPLLSFG